MSNGSISEEEIPTPEKGIRKKRKKKILFGHFNCTMVMVRSRDSAVV
jgi:hypothetical protein